MGMLRFPNTAINLSHTTAEGRYLLLGSDYAPAPLVLSMALPVRWAGLAVWPPMRACIADPLRH